MSHRERILKSLIEETAHHLADAVELLESAQLNGLRKEVESLMGRVLEVQKSPDCSDKLKAGEFSMISIGHLRVYIAGSNKLRVENSANGDFTDISTTPAGKKTYLSTGSTV